MRREKKLFQSIKNNDFPTFINLLSYESILDINYVEDEGNPSCFLCLACYCGREKMVEELLRRGINPNGNCWKEGDYNCAIRLSLQVQNLNIVKILILSGSDYNYKLTFYQIIIGSCYYRESDEITFRSDLEKYKISEEKIIPLIGRNIKGISRK